MRQLRFAHGGSSGVHGDARIANVLVRQQDQGEWQVRFIDFEVGFLGGNIRLGSSTVKCLQF